MNAFSKMLIEFTATRHTSENWKGAVIDFLFLHAHARESKIAVSLAPASETQPRLILAARKGEGSQPPPTALLREVRIMECPICENELELHDYYGRICAHQDGKVIGDIYQCPTCLENCEDTVYYHVRRDDGVLREGYPC